MLEYYFELDCDKLKMVIIYKPYKQQPQEISKWH